MLAEPVAVHLWQRWAGALGQQQNCQGSVPQHLQGGRHTESLYTLLLAQ